MAATYITYQDNAEHIWYDSSNVMYSMCYDNPTTEKPLKVIFKQGKTYLYENVSLVDYIEFRNAESQGRAIQKIIKKYKCKRLVDTDMDTLSELKEKLQTTEQDIQDKSNNLMYKIIFNDVTGEFEMWYNDMLIYSGIEGQVSIIKLLKAMHLNFLMVSADIDSHIDTPEFVGDNTTNEENSI